MELMGGVERHCEAVRWYGCTGRYSFQHGRSHATETEQVQGLEGSIVEMRESIFPLYRHDLSHSPLVLSEQPVVLANKEGPRKHNGGHL